MQRLESNQSDHTNFRPGTAAWAKNHSLSVRSGGLFCHQLNTIDASGYITDTASGFWEYRSNSAINNPKTVQPQKTHALTFSMVLVYTLGSTQLV